MNIYIYIYIFSQVLCHAFCQSVSKGHIKLFFPVFVKFKSYFSAFDGVVMSTESYQLCCWTGIVIPNHCQLNVTSTLAKCLSVHEFFVWLLLIWLTQDSPHKVLSTQQAHFHLSCTSIGLQFSIVMDGKIAQALQDPRPNLFIDCLH